MATVSKAKDPRSTRRYRAIREIVLEQEPRCWLRFVGCLGRSTTADHVITVETCRRFNRLDLVTDRANLHGACSYCNYARGDRPIEQIRHLMGAADAIPMRVFD